MAVVLGGAACAADQGPAQIPLGGGVGARDASADVASLSMQYPMSFVLADGVGLPASNADAWRWDAPGADEVAGLAARLGVPGSPVPVPATDGGGWTVGDPMAGVSPSLTVVASGAWSAWSGNSSSVVTVDGCDRWVVGSTEPAGTDDGPDVTIVDGSGSCDDVAAIPPSDLPSDEDLLVTVRSVFGEATEVVMEWRDEWGAAMRIDYLVDGRSSGQTGFYSVYGSGWSASGLLGTPVRQGRYPTISASDAVARLLDSPLGLGRVAAPGGAGMPSGMLESATPVLSEPAVPDTLPIDPLPPGKAPVEPLVEPQPEPTEVVLLSVEATLVPFTDATGAAWALPGYVFVDTDGGEWEVVAVADAYFDESPDLPDDPSVDQPIDGDTPVGDDGSVGGVVAPSPGSGPIGGAEPGVVPTPPDVVGQTEADAVNVLERAGLTVRVVERDGEQFMVTRDYRTDRVNLVVSEGVVTSVWVG